MPRRVEIVKIPPGHLDGQHSIEERLARDH
jgi:hypothetical protein